MLLVKCKCGNSATLDDDFFTKRRTFRCPNCREELDIGHWTEMQRMPTLLQEAGFELYSLPAETTFDFNFSMKK